MHILQENVPNAFDFMSLNNKFVFIYYPLQVRVLREVLQNPVLQRTALCDLILLSKRMPVRKLMRNGKNEYEIDDIDIMIKIKQYPHYRLNPNIDVVSFQVLS